MTVINVKTNKSFLRVWKRKQFPLKTNHFLKILSQTVSFISTPLQTKSNKSELVCTVERQEKKEKAKKQTRLHMSTLVEKNGGENKAWLHCNILKLYYLRS